MEKVIEGLSLQELEAHDGAELLPDRVEMRRVRKRRRSGNVECTSTNVGGLFNLAKTLQICQRINA